MLAPPEPFDAPADIPFAEAPPGDRLGDWNLLPTKPNWAREFGDDWLPGESGAGQKLQAFAANVAAYSEQRDRPSIAGTSSLSPHLHWGEVSAAQVWHALDRADGGKFL